jgi:hypothetical protein
MERPMLKYRHTTVEDLPKIEEWIAADPAHAGVMKGTDFVLIPDEAGELPKGRQCIEVQDDEGILFYINLKQAMIMEVQFPPDPKDKTINSNRHKIRIARATKEMVQYFCFAAKKLGYYTMFYESVSASLTAFCEKHLGFRKADNFHKAEL